MHSVARIVSAVLVAVGIACVAGACSSSGAPSAQASAATGAAVAPSSPVKSSPANSSPANYPVDLQPQTAAPGSHVMVYGLTCSATTGTASSDAFAAPVALSMISNATGGSATVKPGIAPGRYTVKVTCGEITATGTLTVS